MLTGTLVAIYFWNPKNSDPITTMFSWAIALGALLAVANTAYWQVLGQLIGTIWGDATAAYYMRPIGNWLDGIFKGGAAVVFYLHMRAALLRAVPKEDQHKWFPCCRRDQANSPFVPKSSQFWWPL